MAFEPNLRIGQILSNSDIVTIFGCGNSGGMRRVLKNNILVLIADYTKGLYHDRWIGGVLHYTGMGQEGDQNIEKPQNSILANCKQNEVDIHLFEVLHDKEYTYCGRVELVDKPYTEIQPDRNGNNRIAWVFPIRPVTNEYINKPEMYVFKDMEDYKNRGKNVDIEYARIMAKKKERHK